MTTATKPALIEQHTATDKRSTCLDLDLLTKSTHVQVREEVDATTVARYTEAYLTGVGMPPITVFEERVKLAHGDDLTYWLADGHHRVAGAKKAKLAEINALVKKGDRRAALLYALSANHQHGLPLTSDDKRRSVGPMLADVEWRAWSDRTIAEACHVSANLVAKCRAKLPAEQQSTVRKSKDGRTRNVAKIGKTAKAEPAAPAIDRSIRDQVETLRHAITERTKAQPYGTMNTIKHAILAALLMARRGIIGDQGGLSRDLLEECVGCPLDVHPGQLRGSNLIHGDHSQGYFLSDEAEHDLFPCITAITNNPGVDAGAGPNENNDEPEELTIDEDKPAAVSPAPAPAPKTTALTVDQSRVGEIMAATRLALADQLDKGKHQWHGNDRQVVSLALVVGVPTTDEPLSWSDDLIPACYTILADRLKAEVVDRLRHPDARRLPPFAVLAAWWGIDLRVVAAIAERKVG